MWKRECPETCINGIQGVSGILCKWHSSFRPPVFKTDGQLIYDKSPISDRRCPFFGNIHGRQIQQFSGGLIRGE